MNKNLIILLLFLLTTSLSYSQEWLKIISDPASNYFTAEHAFRMWQDSIEIKSKKRGVFNLFNKGKVEEMKAIREEAEEHFMQWAQEKRRNIDENGNPLSTEALWSRFSNERFQNNLNLFSGSQGNWYSRGPDRIARHYGDGIGIGRISCMVIDPNDSNILYAATPYGGLWKSIDEGGHWTPMLDSLAGLVMTGLAIDPVNGNNLFAIIGWKLFKSSDGAVTWTEIPIPNPSPGFINIRMDKSDPQVVYISSSYHGLLKSTDGGNTFSQINTINLYDIEIKPGNVNTLYGLNNIYLMRSVDGGITFDTSATIPPAAARHIAVTPADSQYIYACGGTGSGFGGQAAVSTDGGDSFTALPSTNNIDSWSSFDNFAVSEVDKNLLIHGGTVVSASLDGGQTWNFVSKYFNNPADSLPYVHPDDMDVMFHGNSVWVCNDGAIVKSVDAGESWTVKSDGISVGRLDGFDCSESDSSFFIAGAWDNSILLHTDSGWAGFGGGDGYDVAINPLNKYNFYGKNQYGFYRSINGTTQSATWPFQNITESYYGYHAGFPIKFNHQNQYSVYISVNHVWKSTDDGDNVTMLPMTGGPFLFVSPADSNIIFSYRDRTVDNGVTVTHMPYDIRAIDPDEPGKVWAVRLGTTYQIYFSNDTGNTWTNIPSPDVGFNSSGGTILMSCANNSYNGIFLCYNSMIYYLDDRLSNWQPFSKNLPFVSVTNMITLPSYSKIRVSTHGRGIWESSSVFDSTQAPVADFIPDKDSICPTNAIHFYDNSLNNGPGYHPVYHWYFPGGSPSTSSSASPIIYYYTPGTYDVTLSFVNDNGSDSITKTFVINVASPPIVGLPYSEGFENGTVPPPDWNWNNYSTNVKWKTSFNFGGYGLSTKAIQYNTFASEMSMSDIITMPEINFSIPFPAISFDYIYANDSLLADTLKLFYSTDCGVTRNYLMVRGGADLITDSIPYNLTFHPTAASWRTDTILLDSLAGQSVQLGFEAVSGGASAFYIDNINIFNLLPNDVKEINANEITIYPNPVSEVLNINLNELKNYSVTISIYDLPGEMILRSNSKGFTSTQIDLSEIKSGVYFIVVEGGGKKTTKKIVLIK